MNREPTRATCTIVDSLSSFCVARVLKTMRLFFLLLFLANLAPRAHADDAGALLDQAKRATGGAAWDQVASMHRVYTTARADGDTHDMHDMHAGDDLTDVQSGRYAASVATPSGLPLRFGWDGQRAWDSQYGISAYQDATDADLAFIKCLGQWYARCGPGTASDEGERQHGGANYRVVRIVSSAHNPIEFWIARATHRIERVGYGPGLRKTLAYADFRPVGALLMPFEERTTSPDSTLITRVSHIELNPATPAAAYAKPVDSPIDGLAGHPDGVTVDLDQCADQAHLCASIMLNGRGPFRFVLDSGAAMNVVTPAAAARLGLTSQGKLLVQGTSDSTSSGTLVTIARTSLGTLTQADQTFAVVPIGYPGVDGLLGFQWLRQAVTRIAWATRKVTFYDPAAWVYRGTAPARSLDFHGNVPRVEARIDGHAGWFNLDIGDFAGVTVNPAFARATGLDIAYPTGEESHYGGVGGGAYALMTTAKLLEFGSASLQGPQLQLSHQTHDLLSKPGLAGNLGYGVLHRFDIVLDYPGSRIYFEPNLATPVSTPADTPAAAGVAR